MPIPRKEKRINKRVLIVGEFGSINGGENSLLAMVPRLREFGWQFSAAVPGQSDFAAALESADIEVHPWSVRSDDQSRKTPEQISSELRELVYNVAPAILHFNSLSTSRLGGPIAKQLGVPSLGYLRDILKLSKKAISDLNQLDRIIAVSEATRQWHIGQGLDSQKSFTVHNGIDVELFGRSVPNQSGQSRPTEKVDVRTELSIPADAPVLIFVGQIGMRKGVEVLIESFFQVAAQTLSLIHI